MGPGGGGKEGAIVDTLLGRSVDVSKWDSTGSLYLKIGSVIFKFTSCLQRTEWEN